MNANPSYTLSNTHHRIESTYDRPVVTDSATAADDTAPHALLAMPADVRGEIFQSCLARDITRLACVSVAMYRSLTQHPVIRVLAKLTAPCHYARLVGGMEAIQSTPLQYRAPLMREYASRTGRIEDGDGAIPWRYYTFLCESQLRADRHVPNQIDSLRDLCIVQPIAMLRLSERPMQYLDKVYSWEEELEVLSPCYRAELIDALLGLNSGINSQDRHVWTMTDIGQRCRHRSSLRFVAVMAALQLFDRRAHDVCHRFIKSFALTSQQRTTTFEPVVVEALAEYFSQHGGDLNDILDRWGMNHGALVPALHDALMHKALEAMRSPWADTFDCAATAVKPSVHVHVTEHVLGFPATAREDLDTIRSVMPTFWTLYWPGDRFPSIQSGRQAWQKVMEMRWQVQPTLLERIVCRTGFAGADVEDCWGPEDSLARWEAKIFATCVASERPRLAVRALTIACQLSRFKDHGTRSRILQRALTLASENTPAWSWNELMEVLCQHRAGAMRIPHVDWPGEADTERWMITFLSDPATCMVSPSPMLVAVLTRNAESIWHHLPEGDGGNKGRFERLCDRLDLLQRDRRSLKTALNRHFFSETFAM